MMKLRYSALLPVTAIATGALTASLNSARAAELVDNETTHIEANVEVVVGAFHSQQGYAQSETSKAGGRDWQEGYAKYGLDAAHSLQRSSLYANVAWVSSATLGQGDAASVKFAHPPYSPKMTTTKITSIGAMSRKLINRSAQEWRGALATPRIVLMAMIRITSR